MVRTILAKEVSEALAESVAEHTKRSCFSRLRDMMSLRCAETRDGLESGLYCTVDAESPRRCHEMVTRFRSEECVQLFDGTRGSEAKVTERQQKMREAGSHGSNPS